jgi:hypothetical protein
MLRIFSHRINASNIFNNRFNQNHSMFRVFCDVAPCSHVEVNFNVTTWRYIGPLQRDYTALQPRRLCTSHSAPWEPEISQNQSIISEMKVRPRDMISFLFFHFTRSVQRRCKNHTGPGLRYYDSFVQFCNLFIFRILWINSFSNRITISIHV